MKICSYLASIVTGMLLMGCIIMVSINLNAKSDVNKVEHIKTGDIDWVCIDNGDYTRSCDVIQKYQ
jgi:hypothetical protein